MTDDELQTLSKLMENAKSEEERRHIQEQWLPHLSRCLVSTNLHVKAVEEAVANLTATMKEINDKMSSLHSAPSWKDDKVGWIKANWMWCVILLYVLQSLFGIDVASLIRDNIAN